MKRFGARRGAATRHDHIAGLHEQMDHFRITFEVTVKFRMIGAPVDQLVVGLLVFSADHDGLHPVGVLHQRRQKLKMLVRSVSTRREKDREEIGPQAKTFHAQGAAFLRRDRLEHRTRQHQIAPHP